MSQFSESDKEFDPTQLPEDQKRTLAAAQKGEADPDAKYIMEAGQVLARFKIEITFHSARSLHKPTPFLMKIYESGKYFHGGGDDVMYWCKDWRVDASWSETPGCGLWIPSSSIRADIAVCPHCNKMIDARYLTGERLFVLMPKEQATVVEKQFRELRSDADVYCKFHKTDLRYAAYEKNYGEEKARQFKAPFIYPLARILTDVSAGSSLHDRLVAFLVA